MTSRETRATSRLTASAAGIQQSLFAAPGEPSPLSVTECRIVDRGKRRDGGTRYWCLAHKSDATAKYGRLAERCRSSHVAPITAAETLTLEIDRYKGGVALWGAVPPVYDTTQQPLDRGIHVHARRVANGRKEIDSTYRAIRLVSSRRDLPSGEFEISELDAIYYMVTSIFGYEMKHIACSYCGYSHLDKDWFSVHPHRRHLCAGCGRHFRDSGIGIGNPIRRLQNAVGVVAEKPRPARKKLNIRQADFPGGLQIWGSNAALLWTAQGPEEQGIHVHAFRRDGAPPDEDDTFSQVTIDGIRLNPEMVRILMAQSALPHIESRVVAIKCPKCGRQRFSVGDDGFTPTTEHRCDKCATYFSSTGKFRKTIGNPLVEILDRLAQGSIKPRQKHAIALVPETL